MKKRKSKTVFNPKRENLKLVKERIAIRMLMQAINETRAEDELIKMIQSNQ